MQPGEDSHDVAVHLNNGVMMTSSRSIRGKKKKENEKVRGVSSKHAHAYIMVLSFPKVMVVLCTKGVAS